MIDLAIELTQCHSLRAYDAVQLAGAIVVNRELVASELPALIFVSADNNLCEAGKVEGLQVENPNLHPEEQHNVNKGKDIRRLN